jgi:predicted enzyme related to lactoylglutathione lyase
MSVIVWADIPVLDLARASAFYAHVLGVPVGSPPGMADVAIINGEPPGADLYLTNASVPSTTSGTTIYLGTNGQMDAMLERVVAAGGTILGAKVFRGEMVGWLAYIRDTEGNRIGFQEPGA